MGHTKHDGNHATVMTFPLCDVTGVVSKSCEDVRGIQGSVLGIDDADLVLGIDDADLRC